MPGYITAYKNENGNICLYMYPGLLDNKVIYQYLDEEQLPSFKKIVNKKCAVMYFNNTFYYFSFLYVFIMIHNVY